MTSDDRIADLERQVAAEKERADYAWRNTNTIEKARQEELAKRDALTEQVAALTNKNEEQASIIRGDVKQFAASQLREQKLREALVDTLDFLTRHSNRWDGEAGKHPQAIVESASEALALQQDDTALQARLKDEREKCAVKCEQHGQTLGSILAAEIRSMT